MQKQNNTFVTDMEYNDWRLMGQEGYLMDQSFTYQCFNREICIEDYTLCEFCWDSFDDDPENPKMAYFCPSEKVWVCKKCFQDFREHFHWNVSFEPNEEIKVEDTELSKSFIGVYYKAESGEILHPDLDCPEPIGPHWDYNYKGSGVRGWRIYKGNIIKPK